MENIERIQEINGMLKMLKNSEIHIQIDLYGFVKEEFDASTKEKFSSKIKQSFIQKYREAFIKDLEAEKVLLTTKQKGIFD